MRHILLAFALVSFVAVQAQYTVETIPNTKLTTGSYVSNPDNVISEITVEKIDSILSHLEKQITVQVAVVAVNSIGDNDLFEFAEALFNKWGLGNKSNDNGLLILLAKDDHKIRIHTGDGLEGTLPDATCKKIERDFMLPEFKNGNYDNGMLAGITAVNRILTDPRYADELNAVESTENVIADYTAFVIFLLIFVVPVLLVMFFIKKSNGSFSDTKNFYKSTYDEMAMTKWSWLVMAVVFPTLIVLYFGLIDTKESIFLAMVSLYFYAMATLFHRQWRMRKVINRFKSAGNYYQIVEFIRSDQWYWFFMGLLFPLPFFPYFFYHLYRTRLYRNHSRQCSMCQGSMRKLNEKDDDAYLSKAQVMEETLRSIDYDVWQCEKCSATEEWNYPRRSSKYSECPSCKTHAYYLVGRKTIQSATYSHSGKGEETYTCKFCNKSKTSTYTIAKLVESTSSSGSSFSSSSSSSGGSWGGGSSSGGGASSSW
jgi:uncharacterized protein